MTSDNGGVEFTLYSVVSSFFEHSPSNSNDAKTICRLIQGLWLHTQKLEKILLAYDLHKETVAAMMMLYKNTKVKVRSPDGKTDYFDIVAGVLQGDTLAPYLFIIYLDYVLRTSIDKMKDNGFKLAKERSRRYPAQTITDTDYADDIALLANKLALAKTLVHSLERAVACIGLYVNADKMECMCFNGSSLKLVDKFTYFENSVLSTKNDIKTRLAKAKTANNSQSVIWKSDLIDKIKRSFFQAAIVSPLLYGCTTWMLQNVWRKSLMAITQECCEQYWTCPGDNTRQSSRCTTTYHPSQNYLSRTNQTCGTLLEKWGLTHKRRTPVDLYTWTRKGKKTSENAYTTDLFRYSK